MLSGQNNRETDGTLVTNGFVGAAFNGEFRDIGAHGGRHGASRPSAGETLGGIRLSPAELANPAYLADPAFGRTSSGVYGGSATRVDEQAGGFAPHEAEPKEPALRCGDYGYLVKDDGTARLVECHDASDSLTVPAQVDSLEVTSLATGLFKDRADLVAVELPDTLRYIGSHVFDGCISLRTIELPAHLEEIGTLAFAKSGLEQLSIPASVRAIGEKAFFHCKRLLSAELGNHVREIGPSAFAYSGLERVFVPACVEELGFNAFDYTPAQRHVEQGAIRIDAANERYRMVGAGLYREDSFVELVGYVQEYEIAQGTKSVGDGACKRHPTLRRIRVPEGVTRIGDEAFRSNRHLVQADLPESLQSIGSCAFVDTSLSSLRISKNVVDIGDGALLAQGENHMAPKAHLTHIDLDSENPVFYLENGLFCKRNGGPDGGDACLLYVGPDSVVRIPHAVTSIARLAFCGSGEVDELFVHGHVQSFCFGSLSASKTIPLVHVEFGEPVDGCERADFPLPSLTSRFRYITDLFMSADGKTYFNFAYYDAWVTCTTNIAEFARAAIERLAHPMALDEHTLGLYEGIFERKSQPICRYFAEQGNIDALEMLIERGLMDLSVIEAELDESIRDCQGQETACLLEVRRRARSQVGSGLDFTL